MIWGRLFAINGGDGSFFVPVDDEDSDLCSIQRAETWVWDQVNGSECQLTLSSSIGKRENEP